MKHTDSPSATEPFFYQTLGSAGRAFEKAKAWALYQGRTVYVFRSTVERRTQSPLGPEYYHGYDFYFISSEEKPTVADALSTLSEAAQKDIKAGGFPHPWGYVTKTGVERRV